MSRPRKTKADMLQAARDEFKLEVKLQRIRLDMTQGELADQIGMDRSVLSRLLTDSDKLSVGRLRKIVQILNIEPGIVLALLGYSQKQIKDFIADNK